MALRDQIADVSGVVQEIITRTPRVKSFRVAIDNPVPYQAGQWCVVKVTTDKTYSKALSISSSPAEDGYLEFTKKMSGSDFSLALATLKPGDVIGLRYPFGRFILEGEVPRIAFISGGIGITPIRSICRDLADKGMKTDVILLYGNNTLEEIAFKDELDAWQREYPHFRVVHVLRCPPSEWSGKAGFITEELIRFEIPDYKDRRFFMCGPPGMVHLFGDILKCGLALPPEQVVTEDFTGC